MNQTPKEYYNSKSKQDSGNIASVCFLVIALILLLTAFVAEVLH
jgi:hypothetical protein